MTSHLLSGVLESLEILKNGSKFNSEAEKLFKITYRIAFEYIRKNQARLNFLFSRNAIEPEDMAIEVISPLFISRNGRLYDRLLCAYEKWNPPIKTNSDALFFLHHLVFIRSEHHLVKILEKTDPHFAKILHDINKQIVANNFYKIHFLGITYVSLYESILPGRILDNEELINDIPVTKLINSKDFLKDVFNFICSKTHYYPAIPINMLVLKLKNLQTKELLEDIYTNVVDDITLSEIKNNSLIYIYDKINNSYAKKNKFTQDEITILKNSLHDIVEDLLDGGLNGGLFEYFAHYMPGLDYSIYKAKYDNTIEYLVKLLRNRMAEISTKEFRNS